MIYVNAYSFLIWLPLKIQYLSTWTSFYCFIFTRIPYKGREKALHYKECATYSLRSLLCQ